MKATVINDTTFRLWSMTVTECTEESASIATSELYRQQFFFNDEFGSWLREKYEDNASVDCLPGTWTGTDTFMVELLLRFVRPEDAFEFRLRWA